MPIAFPLVAFQVEGGLLRRRQVADGHPDVPLSQFLLFLPRATTALARHSLSANTTRILFMQSVRATQFREDLPWMARMTRISLEQKGTKKTKEGFLFVAFVCFRGNRFPMGALMVNS